MKVSVITPVLNAEQTISGCINSVSAQAIGNIEHIVIDGGSTDRTLNVLKCCDKSIIWSSAPDDGLYDAMNKGISRASGDVIGILNSDDMYADNLVIETVIAYMTDYDLPTCYGDVVYVDRNNPDKIVRRWISGRYCRDRFKNGWMPPHPAFFVKKNLYETYGGFKLNFLLAADYELMVRFLYKHEIASAYIPKILVRMREGGRCHPGLKTVAANIVENYRAWKINGLSPNPITFVLKPMSKLFQYIQ